MCGALGAEVPGHGQQQLMQILIAFVENALFTTGPRFWNVNRIEIELVTRPGLPSELAAPPLGRKQHHQAGQGRVRKPQSRLSPNPIQQQAIQRLLWGIWEATANSNTWPQVSSLIHFFFLVLLSERHSLFLCNASKVTPKEELFLGIQMLDEERHPLLSKFFKK